jgi:hypothetical protein
MPRDHLSMVSSVQDSISGPVIVAYVDAGALDSSVIEGVKGDKRW